MKVLFLLFAGISVTAAEPAQVSAKHVVVYKEQGRFGGWPANHGAWSWGNELLVGFEAGHFHNTDKGHAIDYTRPAEHVLARSMDGGLTWKIEKPETLKPPPGIKQANVPVEEGTKPVTNSPGGIRFTDPNFAMTLRMASIHTGPSRFYYSYDRGKTWQGPYALPDFGTKGVAARTDYIVNGPKDCTVFLTAAKQNGKEGRVFAARTKDGGKTWKFLSYIGPEPEDYAIMPSSLRLGPATILTSLRRRHWIEAWRSEDDGLTWNFVGKPVEKTGGNPPSLVKLKDGRLALTYGYRAEPYSIRARVSKDAGATWSGDLTLRQDGGTWDLGYTRTMLRPDGKLVTVYYYNDAKDSERYIGATIWEAPKE